MLLYLRYVHREEDMLTERFGSAYAAYQLSDVPS
jgi:protein-S-isoprenylcysteine O-methyltransferase Ste14